MNKFDFSKFYYGSADCFISNVNYDVSPIVRVAGVDKNAGYGVVYTALGTRFDIDHVAKEAFTWTESYESDFMAIDRMPIAEAMRYVRTEVIKKDLLAKEYKVQVEAVKAGKNLYGKSTSGEYGLVDSDILFLPGPASQVDNTVAQKFIDFCEKNNLQACVSYKYNDCGYMFIELGLTKELEEMESKLKGLLTKYKTLVTDDAYVLDALNMMFPDKSEKIKFIDEFLYEIAGKPDITKEDTYVVHESGIINRLYPCRKVSYKELLSKGNYRFPNRSGFDVTDTGIAGGLGFFDDQILASLTKRRIKELGKLDGEKILTPCSAEAFALRRFSSDVLTVLDLYS